jgi:putative spermidine/putrescine transport system ATP-binding protein
MYSIRPEKIHLAGTDEAAGLKARATGVIEAVVYLGPVNHYVVRLDEGGTLTVLRQNLHGSADHGVGAEGDRVTLAWADEHLIDLTPSMNGTTGSGPHQEET